MNCAWRFSITGAAAFIFAFILLFSSVLSASAESVPLTSLDLGKVRQGWGKPQVDKAVTEVPMSIGGRKFERGLGSHASMVLWVDLKGDTQRFKAMVGVDDNANSPNGSIVFKVYGDGRSLFKSPVMRTGDQPREVNVDLKGVKTLALMADSTEDGINFDHADWADATFEVNGDRPEAVDPPREKAVILTPKPSPKPKINGPKIFGVRPGSPFLFRIPTTGDRPMTFSVDKLPTGLSVDQNTGIITGSISKPGNYVVTLKAKNALGEAARPFKIVVGDTLALTPTMGWNSWYCHVTRVTEKDMRNAADAMVSSGMADHGYSYVDIDDCWMVAPDSSDPEVGGEPRDAEGRIKTNKRFPDIKGLADYIHSKGLKAGIYTSPGPRTCSGFEGSWQHEAQDARQIADWGFDLLKYDYCSYYSVRKDESLEEHKRPYKLMGDLLKKQDRDIVYNLCQYGMANVWEWGAEVVGNSWRTGGDIGNGGMDAILSAGFRQNGMEKWAGPGHWNDPDYLTFGTLTPNEQYAHMTLWCMLAAPLVYSGDMTRLDDFTLNILCNDEVIEVDQDPLGRQGHRAAKEEDTEVWVKDMEDGSRAVALFNRGEMETTVRAKWSDLNLSGKYRVRDLWRQKDIGEFKSQFETKVPRHGTAMFRIWKARSEEVGVRS